jgi:glycosyltransferase involved in cell wall biosynthesis
MPLVSVIIPTANRQTFLGDAVRSVLTQSVKDLELLIINDGAPGLPDYGDRRITILDNNRRGAVQARILGVQEAKGTYVAFLDDDDLWIDADHLHLATGTLNRSADFFFADGLMRFPDQTQPRHFAQDATALSLERDNTILISAVCYRRNIHAELGAFDLALPYYWDWDWYLRVARSGFRLHHHPHPTVEIRIHAENMSGDSNFPQRTQNLARLAEKHGIGPLVLKNHVSFVTPWRR